MFPTHGCIIVDVCTVRIWTKQIAQDAYPPCGCTWARYLAFVTYSIRFMTSFKPYRTTSGVRRIKKTIVEDHVAVVW